MKFSLIFLSHVWHGKNAKITLCQTRQTNPKIILRQNNLAWHLAKLILDHKIMATRINPMKLELSTQDFSNKNYAKITQISHLKFE